MHSSVIYVSVTATGAFLKFPVDGNVVRTAAVAERFISTLLDQFPTRDDIVRYSNKKNPSTNLTSLVKKWVGLGH